MKKLFGPKAFGVGSLLLCCLLTASVALAEKRSARLPPPPAVPLSQIHVLGDRPAPFALDARAAMLVETHSGEVLYSYNENERTQPASLAKLMTFYITLEGLHSGRLTLDTPVTISKQAWHLSLDPTVSKMFLEVGQQVPIHDLLYGLMVSSGNDAAVALAQYQAGSTAAFVNLMNQYCKKLGLHDTHFETPDGLPEPDQYTTASDMVKLGRTLLENFPNALTYTSAREFTFNKITQRNWNTLIFYDPRVDGLKTGHVSEAGFHLVATAVQGNMRLISAVMGTPSAEKRRTESEKLLAWAFRTYVNYEPNISGLVPARLPVYEGRQPSVAVAPVHPVIVTVPRGEDKGLTVKALMNAGYLVAPVASGLTVGKVEVQKGNETLLTVALKTQSGIARGGFFRVMWDRVALLFDGIGRAIKAALWASVSWLPFVHRG